MRRLTSCALLFCCSTLASGCSSNFKLPWEADYLDPSRVATREPLEVPPDLDQLPAPPTPSGEGSKKSQQEESSPADASSRESAAGILFGTPASAPRNNPAPRSDREQESLPEWIGGKKGP
ncbi:MAG: hypothetical protein HQL59_04810 [Magnetococcales bacterium]|nr:hypothetical protein [Magnetococcales bacterium]